MALTPLIDLKINKVGLSKNDVQGDQKKTEPKQMLIGSSLMMLLPYFFQYL